MRVAKWIAGLAGALLVLGVAGYAAFKLSPWPTVLLIRHTFDADSVQREAALAKHLPKAVTVLRDQPYGSDGNRFDVYRPDNAVGTALPTIVWVHGGAFIAGQKEDVAGYLTILAAEGLTVIGVGYSTAPGATYPAPVRQLHDALGHVVANAATLGIDPTRLVLAGDSAGAQIVAQTLATMADPSYAAAVGVAPTIELNQVCGTVLFCGIFDARKISLDGPFGGFMRTALWSYLGTKDFHDDPRLAEMSVVQHLPPAFPQAFVSVGNTDPLAPQSLQMVDALRAAGVGVDTLFFPDDYTPPLAHEYQFNLDTKAGTQAFEALTGFVARVTK